MSSSVILETSPRPQGQIQKEISPTSKASKTIMKLSIIMPRFNSLQLGSKNTKKHAISERGT